MQQLSASKVEYITHMGTDLTPVNAARVSMNKESKELTDRDKKLIKYLADHEHTSCFEHQALTVRIKCPLFVRSQIHRHRTFSFNEESRRYVTEDLEFYIPDVWRKKADNVKQGSSDECVEVDIDYIKSTINGSLNLYNHLLNIGVAPEQARMILPQNLMTTFFMTGNLRNWMHFLHLRLDKHAQKEVRDVAEQVADIIRTLFPISFENLHEQDKSP